MNLPNSTFIKSSALRPGNIASLSYEQKFPPLTAIEIVPGTVHFEGRTERDDETNVIGYPITSKLLIKHRFATKDFTISTIENLKLNEIPLFEYIRQKGLLAATTDMQFCALEQYTPGHLIIYLFLDKNKIPRPFAYMHELQNIFFDLTGFELTSNFTFD